MNLRLTLTSIILSFSLENADIKSSGIYQSIEAVHELSRNIRFHDLIINLRDKKINYANYPNIYFLISNDHNGKPLYWLRYNFSGEDVQSYFKKLQRTSWGRAVK